MPAKRRTIDRQFTAVAHSHRPNLLVSGCSYTYNNSESCAVTWPYYLQDLAGFDQVWDVSQPASGYNHTHTAVVTELETNSELTPDNTLIIVMWSGNERVDVTVERAQADSWSNMEPQDLAAGLSTIGLWPVAPNWSNQFGQCPDSGINGLRDLYRRLIPSTAQALDSHVQLVSLAGYLSNLGFTYIFLDWEDIRNAVRIPGMDPWAQGRFADVETLGRWATRTGQRIPNDGHPSPDAHLSWTREHLIPYLLAKDHLTALHK